MIIVAVCELMGWDYYTYITQPTWFIDLILDKMSIDAKKMSQSINESKKR